MLTWGWVNTEEPQEPRNGDREGYSPRSSPLASVGVACSVLVLSHTLWTGAHSSALVPLQEAPKSLLACLSRTLG